MEHLAKSSSKLIFPKFKKQIPDKNLTYFFSAHLSASRVAALLYDRWETVRVRLATRQNLLEIQILEDEQYKRMVEGYKSSGQPSPL